MKQTCKFLLCEITIGLLSIVSAGCATEPILTTKSFHVTTKQGSKVSTGKYLVLRGPDCLSGPYTEIGIDTPPQHGQVDVESEIVKFTTLGAGNPHCIGKTGKGKAVYYTSDSSYIGEDNFSYRVSSPQMPSTSYIINVIVDVKP